MRSPAVLWFGLIVLAVSAAPAASPALPAADGLRAAIADLAGTFGKDYPRGAEFLARLDRLQAEAQKAAGPDLDRVRGDFEKLQRESLAANPLVSGRPILFVVRHQYRPDHHNTETMFQTGEINTGSFEGPGSLKLLDIPSGKTTTLLDVPEGVVRDPEVSFDGRRILVALRHNRQDDYHIYQINADGSGLSQLTAGSGVTDIDPAYLPSGEIVFTSTREPKYCMCNRHIMGNLFTMEADGANIHQIAHSTLHEGHSAVLPDGRVLYDRWEYVDRNFGNAQGIWTVNPDGTHPLIWYGNSTDSPGAVLDARPIPGTQAVVATFSSCHDRPWGAIGILDRRQGVDNKPAVVRTWPASAIELVDRGNYDTFTQVRPKYEDPYPLSDKYFLCSRMTGRGEEMGLYLLDVFGNEVLLHAEAPGCFDPMPLCPRPRPPVVPGGVDLAQSEGTFFIADVYRGSGMERVPRGTVRRLRVVESPEKRFFTGPGWDGGTGQQAPGMAWDDFNNKRILGTVPVESDGSAYFRVPADRFVYFQLLDERGMMVQSMRSGTIVRPGETTGCVGCHEGRRTAPESVSLAQLQAGRPGAMPLAVRRPPSEIQPWHGPPRLFDYLAEVQPALDRNCVACHDYGQAAGKTLNLAGDHALIFNTSYIELRGKRFVHVVGAGPAPVQMPKTWGSHASPLVRTLLEGHKDPAVNAKIKLSPEDLDRIITWIDINAPYYPDYASAYRGNLYGRAPLSPKQLGRLGQLVGIDLGDRKHLAAVDFTRPQFSPCLANLPAADPRYTEALAIITEGKTQLAAQPAACLVDPQELAQEAKYESLRRAEAEARQAILRGQKHRP